MLTPSLRTVLILVLCLGQGSFSVSLASDYNIPTYEMSSQSCIYRFRTGRLAPQIRRGPCIELFLSLNILLLSLSIVFGFRAIITHLHQVHPSSEPVSSSLALPSPCAPPLHLVEPVCSLLP